MPPRIRTIKPQFFLNEQLAELVPADRLLFIGLWTQADKAGRLEYRPLRLKAALFPYDDYNVTEGLARLVVAGFITRYEDRGIQLMVINKWAKHQRPHNTESDSELPAPPFDNGCEPVTEPLERKGKEEGREGKGTEIAGSLRARFEKFWAVYPRKVGKDAAWKEWLRRSPDDDLTDRMVAKVMEQRASAQWLKDGGQYIPHPRTWLHQGRWEDEATAIPQLKQQTVNNLQAVRAWANEG